MQKRDGGELKQCAIAEGMETLRQDGWRRVSQGKTTIEEVVRVTQTDEVMAETTAFAEPVVARSFRKARGKKPNPGRALALLSDCHPRVPRPRGRDRARNASRSEAGGPRMLAPTSERTGRAISAF